MTFDLERDFSYVLKKGEFAQIYSLFAMTKIVALFLQTACTKNNADTREYHAKLMFENTCQKIESSAQSVIIKLVDLDNEQHFIFQNYLFNIYNPLHQQLENRYTYFIDRVYIEYEVKQKNNIELGLYDEFLGISHNNIDEFFSFSEQDTFVHSDAIDTLNSFMFSSNIALMMIGTSGSGKTTVLKYWVNSNNANGNIIIPFVGREHRLLQLGPQVFTNWLNDDEKIKMINDLFCCRKQHLVLIYDAINEMPGDFNFLQENYNSLVDFADKLALQGCMNIKLILTMRTDTFLQLKQNNSKELKTGVFYTTFSETGDIDNVYEMPVFNQNQALELLTKYVSDTMRVQYLYKRFFNVLQTPFYIQLFAKIVASLPNSSEKDFTLISSKWYDELFQRITQNEFELHEALIVADNIIINKHLRNSASITIEQLSQSLKKEEKEVVIWIQKLKETGILYFDYISKQIGFTHDIYEEIFMAKLLTRIEAPEQFCASVLQHTREQGTMRSALCSYLQMLRVDKEDQYFLVLIRFFRLNIITLTRMTLAAIIHIQESFPMGDFWLHLFDLIDMNIGLIYHAQLLRCVLQEFNNSIEQKQVFSINILDSLQIAIYTETNSKTVLKEDIAFFEYTYARYLYVYAYLFDENVLDKAKLRCLKALSLLDEGKKYLSIYDDVSFLYSVLLRYEGNIIKAADLLENILDNQLKHFMTDKACQTALELGAILREQTRFEDALNVYIRIRNNIPLTPYYNARLKMNTAIIYKNKLQIKESFDVSDMSAFLETEKLFLYVHNFASITDDVLLSLEIQAELIELYTLSTVFDEQGLQKASKYLREMEVTLPKYPVPLRQIQYYRMKARVQLADLNYLESLSSLRQGYELAIKYNIPYRACDCCRKFANIVLKHISYDKELIKEALIYIDFTIEYYKTLHQKNHVYLQESLKLQKQLQDL